MVHGDDLWLQADEVSLAQLLPRLDAEHGGLYDLKSDGVLGPDPGDARQVRSLNKVIRFIPPGRGWRSQRTRATRGSSHQGRGWTGARAAR